MINDADADFYGLERLLDDAGRSTLQRTREFMTKRIEPVINRYWTREEWVRRKPRSHPWLQERPFSGWPTTWPMPR
jgi:hypothetical protein